MLFDCLVMLFQFAGLFFMKLAVDFEYFLNVFDILDIFGDFFVEFVVGFFAYFHVGLLLLAGGPDIVVEVRNHLFKVESNRVDVFVLDFDFP